MSNIYVRVLFMSCSLWIIMSFTTSCRFIHSIVFSWFTTHPASVLNSWRSCNAAPFHGRHTGGFAGGKVGMRYPLPWFHSSVCPNRNNPQTKQDCLLHRSSLLGCRFGRSGSSVFVGRFRLLRWSSYVPMPRVLAYRTCPTSGLEDSCGYGLLITWI